MLLPLSIIELRTLHNFLTSNISAPLHAKAATDTVVTRLNIEIKTVTKLVCKIVVKVGFIKSQDQGRSILFQYQDVSLSYGPVVPSQP